MAKRIDASDVQRVLSLVAKHVGNLIRRSPSVKTGDDITILISGWGHKEGWSRGFAISSPSKHTSPTYDADKRYEGRGWHSRMAEDITKVVSRHRHHHVPTYCGKCKPSRGLA